MEKLCTSLIFKVKGYLQGDKYLGIELDNAIQDREFTDIIESSFPKSLSSYILDNSYAMGKKWNTSGFG
jgi:hypothetical protein